MILPGRVTVCMTCDVSVDDTVAVCGTTMVEVNGTVRVVDVETV